VATQLADSPPERGLSENAPEISPGSGAPPPAAAPEPGSRSCESCGARLAPGQDWCLQCGAGAPGSVGGGSWRPLAGVLAATAVLVLGAAAAGYAALSKTAPQAAVLTRTVAQATVTPPATASTPLPTTPAPLPGGVAKPPRIPLKAVTPAPAVTTPLTTPSTSNTNTGTGTGTGTTNSSGTGGSNAGEEPKPKALLLDTDAASTYNPYSYPATWFGDPSLAIDGDTTTGWSAQVNPATAPNLAEGLVIDLKSPRKLSAMKVVTSTPGLTAQVYGSAAKTLPASITAAGWVPLSRSITIRKRHARLGLRHQKKGYRFVALWISKAPASALGTTEAPGKVIVDELELLPAG
jgi:hypothetical protein